MPLSDNPGPITIVINKFLQIPEIRTGKDKIDAVVVDEESVGSVNQHGYGAKILSGEGALDIYLEKHNKESVVRATIICILHMAHLLLNPTSNERKLVSQPTFMRI
jgi:hypothetical protein